jgi:hypothetical protein
MRVLREVYVCARVIGCVHQYWHVGCGCDACIIARFNVFMFRGVCEFRMCALVFCVCSACYWRAMSEMRMKRVFIICKRVFAVIACGYPYVDACRILLHWCSGVFACLSCTRYLSRVLCMFARAFFGVCACGLHMCALDLHVWLRVDACAGSCMSPP